ncbi:MAG: hypothetical protein ACYTA5_09100 [Planctomycetota bacterium]|jgi:hypothetical protein
MKRRLYEKANFVIKSIQKLGVNLPQESRLMREYKVLVGPDGKGKFVPSDHPDYEIALEAIRDFTLLEYVFDNIKIDSNPKFIDLVKKVLKDSVLPQHDRKLSVGRNAQAELYMATVCSKGGMTDVRFDEPDILCTIGESSFSVAVKRLKNVRKLRNRVKNAADQIARSGVLGTIVLDMTLAFNIHNKRIVDKMPDSIFATLWRQEVNLFISSHEKDIRKWVRGKNVLCLIIQHHEVRDNTGKCTWRLETLTVNMPLVGRNRHKARMFKTFWSMYESALPDLTKLDKVGS